jgi:hypothetical protein
MFARRGGHRHNIMAGLARLSGHEPRVPSGAGFVWPPNHARRNEAEAHGNPALRIGSRRSFVINGVIAFYEFLSHNGGMELRHLRYFVAVAEELHFARAAERLNIAGPTLSHQISALESILGAKLFTRRTKSAVALTHPGKHFLIEARDTLKQAEHAELVGRQAGRGDAGSISAGYVLSAGFGGLVSTSFAGFRKSHPGVSFQLTRMQPFRNSKDSLTDRSILDLRARFSAIHPN